MWSIRDYNRCKGDFTQLPGLYEVELAGSKELRYDVPGLGTIILLKESSLVKMVEIEEVEAERIAAALL